MGKIQLGNSFDSASTYPVIATTSELMTTRIDARTRKLIVLDQRILAVTKRQQTIGRGTRVNENEGVE